jgi:diacylglycerol kinase (ATP)
MTAGQDDLPPGKKTLLIANPTSGLGRTGRLADSLARRLGSRGLEVDLALTRSDLAAAHLASAAVARAYARVIVAGGDGTINSVVGGLANTPIACGVIPTGMANAFAREMDIPLSLDAACDVAAGSAVRVIDLARAGSRHFALMAGVGFDADVVAHVNPRLKRIFGPAAYVAAGLARIATYRPSPMTLAWDDGELSAPVLMLVAANTAQYTYKWRIALHARPDDGVLDVVAFTCRNALDVPAHVVGALTGRHGRHPSVVVFRTKRLRITCERVLPLQLDGDPAGAAPEEMEVVPGALRVIAPSPSDATVS